MNSKKNLTIIPIIVSRRFGKFKLGPVVCDAIKKNGERLQANDVIVVSSKFAAMAEGRYVDLRRIKPSAKALSLSRKYDLDPSLAHLVVKESEVILGGIKGYILAISQGILAPNAGIDRSNVPHNYAILYPRNPKRTAERLRSYLESCYLFPRQLGVILADSRITPARLGTIGIAISSSGFKPVEDFRGHKDLFGNRLKVTVKAVADEISSAAQLVMGEADESTPIVIVRGYVLDTDETNSLSMLLPHERCLYIQGLKNGNENSLSH